MRLAPSEVETVHDSAALLRKNLANPDRGSQLPILQSSLVNTLPKTKKGKYTAVTEAHKECT